MLIRFLSAYRCCAAIAFSGLALSACGGLDRARVGGNGFDIPDSLNSHDLFTATGMAGEWGDTALPFADERIFRVDTFGFCSDYLSQTALDTLTALALDRNLGYRGVFARIEQAQAAYRLEGATLFPIISAEASATRGASPGLGGLGLGGAAGEALPPGFELPDAGAQNTFRVAGAASYEINLWGRVFRQRQAANFDLLAARADARSAAVTLAAQVAQAWLDVVAARQRLRLFEKQMELSEKFLELTRFRFGQGMASALDVNQQTQQVEAVRGQLALAHGEVATSWSTLLVLVGATPGSAAPVLPVIPDSLPSPPPLPASLPIAALLNGRPDLEAARLRLEAADARAAAAFAALFPDLRFGGSLFYQAAELGQLFEELFWQVSASLTQSVFDGGRRQALRAQAQGQALAQLWQYRETLLNSLVDLRNALILGSAQAIQLNSLERQLEIARQSLELARISYREGGIEYLRVLDALRSLQQAELNLLEARRGAFASRIQLCRAAGGGAAGNGDPERVMSPSEPYAPSNGASPSPGVQWPADTTLQRGL